MKMSIPQSKALCLRSCGVVAVFLMVFLFSQTAPAAKVTVNIKVLNPENIKQPYSVREYLPPRIQTNDILNLDGLELGYDVKMESYYVFKEIELAPKQLFSKNVEIRDIWVIPPEELDGLKKRAADLTALLGGKEQAGSAEGLKPEIERNLNVIKQRQDDFSIKPGVRVQDHITAYDRNILDLRRIKEAIGVLENLVLASGQDPGGLVGEMKNLPEPDHKVEIPTNLLKTADYRVTISNSLPREIRQDWSHELPAEIAVTDIRKAEGLSCKTDIKTGRVRIFTNDLTIAAGGAKTFTVEIWDRWNINFARIQNMRNTSSNLLTKISTKEKYPSIENAIKGIITELDKVEKEPVPTKLNDQYVAFFRDQGMRLDRIENQINRLVAALRPIEKESKMGFKAKPPSSRTTWMIIYIILGFLAFLSLVFFFRWVGGSKTGKIQGGEGG